MRDESDERRPRQSVSRSPCGGTRGAAAVGVGGGGGGRGQGDRDVIIRFLGAFRVRTPPTSTPPSTSPPPPPTTTTPASQPATRLHSIRRFPINRVSHVRFPWMREGGNVNALRRLVSTGIPHTGGESRCGRNAKRGTEGTGRSDDTGGPDDTAGTEPVEGRLDGRAAAAGRDLGQSPQARGGRGYLGVFHGTGRDGYTTRRQRDDQQSKLFPPLSVSLNGVC